MKLRIIIIFLVAVVGNIFTSCNDWTETENLKTDSPSIGEMNPNLYQEYLDNLRKYKKSQHPLMIGWFDNSNKNYASKGAHIDQIPDKVDILSLIHPDNLTDNEIDGIASLKEKGTSVIYTIDCQAFQDEITAKNNAIESKNSDLIGAGKEPLPLIVLTDTLPIFLDNRLALMDKYKYDGFCVVYNGQLLWSLPNETKEQLKKVQTIIFDKLMPVISANPDKIYMYEGLPQYLLIDRAQLMNFNYLVFRTYTASSIYDVTRYVQDGLVFSDIPADRVIVQAAPEFTADDGTVYGKILNANGKSSNAIETLAGWVRTTVPEFKKAGMGVWMINKDYYIPGSSYSAVQKAIDIMNPSVN